MTKLSENAIIKMISICSLWYWLRSQYNEEEVENV